MIYRELGHTGYRVSQLGFGAMRLPMKGEGDSEQVDRELAKNLGPPARRRKCFGFRHGHICEYMMRPGTGNSHCRMQPLADSVI